MSRPALSALRALEIIDLMAGLPAQAFTLSEIVRRTGTNVASCHAILGALVGKGYLLRHPAHKTYRLAPSIIAIGEAAAAHDPVLASARESAAAIAAQTGMETLITTRAGDDIIGVARYAGAVPGRPSLRVGQRVPLRPPIGGLFVAWGPEEAVERWIAPEGDATPPETRAAHAAALALQKARGFLITLDSPGYSAFSSEIVATSAIEAGQAAKLSGLLATFDNGLYQPETIEVGQHYKVRVISAPIFGDQGTVLYTLNLHVSPGEMDGARLLALSSLLLDGCAASMQSGGIDDRAIAALR